jgi:hypothetical protein
MFTIFEEDRVTQPLYLYTRIGRARRLRTQAELSRATSGCPDRISQETQWHAPAERLSERGACDVARMAPAQKRPARARSIR